MPTLTVKSTMTVKDGVLVTVKRQAPRDIALVMVGSLLTGAWSLLLTRKLTGAARVASLVGGVLRLAVTVLGAGAILQKFIDAQTAKDAE